MDRLRRPLVGDEIRPCWEARVTAAADQPGRAAIATRSAASTVTDPGVVAGRSQRQFVELDQAPRAGDALPSRTDAAPAEPLGIIGERPPPQAVEPGWTLWGEGEA
jgi:hypothetical protein